MRCRIKIFTVLCMVFILAAGCGLKGEPPLYVAETEEKAAFLQAEEGLQQETAASFSEGEEFAAIYRSVYDNAEYTGAPFNLETMRGILERFGEYGYAAVDRKNQLDMVNADQVIRFCEAVNAKMCADLTIIAADDGGMFTKYRFGTEEGEVDISREDFRYEDGGLKKIYAADCKADVWRYTKEGYLLFEGSYYSKEYYLLALDETPECAALRVEPLDSKCREFNRTCILPVGYRQNNIFLVDWSEEDFGELDFYDAFDRFYPLLYDRAVPYTEDENLGVGAVYGIKEEEFETVVQAFIEVGSQELRVNTVYDPQRKAYEYKPRGFEEKEYPQIPYPEVVSSEERADGTIALTVHAVYPEGNTSRAFSHQTVIRPREDGGFCFVSNRRIFSDQDQSAWWHSDRLSAEKWNEIYGEND